MATYNNSVVGEYMQLKSIPSFLSATFLVLTFHTFGGVDPLHVNWGIDYTLTAEHALYGSLVTYLVAFASSETKEFSRYDDVEKALIAAGPAVLVIHEYQWLISSWSTGLEMAGFALAAVSWMVAVR